MTKKRAPVSFWAPPPQRRLQAFEDIDGYLRTGRAPWREDGEGGPVGVVDRESEEASTPRTHDFVVPRFVFHEMLAGRFARELLDASVNRLTALAPQASAQKVLTRPQIRVVFWMVLIGLTITLAAPQLSYELASGAFAVFFCLIIGFRLFLAVASWRAPPGAAPEPLEAADADLPVITILLPLYREASALDMLCRSIDALDYPSEKLDVKVLLEADDHETIQRARALGLERRFHVVIVPPVNPRTKPKACNYGLSLARGAYVVIYDAEDLPQRDQLRKALAVFAQSSAETACVQARLNFYNVDENWLTRAFALEYALWFDSFLPALERIGAPIPLGGTSNFFRTDILRGIGGWDPYNVTEDADLGMRLARCGYRTAIMDSTTFEEANSQIGNWMRQRSRWMKGYLQTWLVHMRAPAQMIRAVGWGGFLSVQLFVFGTVFWALIMPLMWLAILSRWAAAALAYYGAGAPLGVDGLADWGASGVSLSVELTLIGGANGVFILLAMIAPLKRGWVRLCPYALLFPFYWAMMSAAAYKALWQLIRRPHFWEKTHHILSFTAARARRRALDVETKR